MDCHTTWQDQEDVTAHGRGAFSTEGPPEEGASGMALFPAKVIVCVRAISSGGLAELAREWVLHADGQVSFRFTEVDGRRERNP